MAVHTHHITNEQIKNILQDSKVLDGNDEFTSSRITNGFCNPIYHIKMSSGNQYILKVTNPIWKKLKTRNEAIVLNFLHKYTSIPVPKVISYSNTNELIGYEYILMTYVPGIPLSDVYDSLSFEERKPYLFQLVKIYVEMVNIDIRSTDMNKLGCFEKINEKDGAFEAVLCPNVDSLQGPHNNIYDYSCDYIKFRFPEMLQSKYSHYVPKFEAIINSLREEQQKTVFDERVVLTHTDIAPKNVIIDPETKTVQALIDWEWSSLMVVDQDFETMTLGGVWKGEQELVFLRETLSTLLGEQRMKTYQEQFEKRKNMNDAVSEAMVIVAYQDWYHGREHLLEQAEKDLERDVQDLFSRFDV
ncbi:unnamed protein product [Adineta ricciae]|uniref:Aminoglycoside phosphotransferase domain-containing protein n=1 Tax=Adineta ricciae TaxID=249248 RepID=A0A813SLS6_ADIRI|nr:unnamed protein product [Adineta ricciae]